VIDAHVLLIDLLTISEADALYTSARADGVPCPRLTPVPEELRTGNAIRAGLPPFHDESWRHSWL